MADLLSDREQTVKDAQIARKPELLSFHVYERSYPRGPADLRWCVAAVHEGSGRVGFHQCNRKPKHEYGGHGWCSRHYPPNEEARRQKRHAEWLVEREARTRAWDDREAAEKLKVSALEAIRQIAAGHNDPRALALEVLATPRRA